MSRNGWARHPDVVVYISGPGLFRSISVWRRSVFPPLFAARPNSPGTHFCRSPSLARHGGHKRPSRFLLLWHCSRRHAEQPALRNCYLRVVRIPEAACQSKYRRDMVSSSRCARSSWHQIYNINARIAGPRRHAGCGGRQAADLAGTGCQYFNHGLLPGIFQ
jgi:hypothetical protein